MAIRLTLFVAATDGSTRRIAAALRAWCGESLGEAYQLDVCDIHRLAQCAESLPALAVPALALASPPALVVGDLSDVPRVMAALGLSARAA